MTPATAPIPSAGSSAGAAAPATEATSAPAAVSISATEIPASAGATGTAAVPPWERSFFYCAPGEAMTLIWVILLHVSTIVGLCLLPWPTWQVLAIAGGLLFIGGLGTTVCYHRALTHRALTLNPVVENILIFFTMLNGSGRPLSWVANHRLHHATSDSDGDISSPRQGFMWAHLRWLWQAEQGKPERFCKDFTQTRYRFWHNAQIPVLALSFFGGLLYAVSGAPFLEVMTLWLWVGPIRLLWALHTQCTVNSICHLGKISPERDSSLNVWWLALMHLGHGENWHANHHGDQADPRLGRGFFQLDLGWWTIRTLKLCGLASKIRVRSASAK